MDYLENSLNFIEPTELNLYYCGKRIQTNHHEYGPAVRSHFLIIYVKEGHGTIYSEEPHLHLKEGAIFFMFPDHRIHYKVDPDTTWTILWIGVYGCLVDYYVKMLGLTPQNPIFYPHNTHAIEDVLNRIFEKSQQDTLCNQIYCLSLVQKFFSILFEDFPENNIKNSHINQAIYYMKLNYNLGISAKDVAKRLNIDQSYFTRIFKRECNSTPNEWLTNFRLQKSCELLRDTALPICEIANSVGIFDSLYFSRLFKKHLLVSPNEYRKKIN